MPHVGQRRVNAAGNEEVFGENHRWNRVEVSQMSSSSTPDNSTLKDFSSRKRIEDASVHDKISDVIFDDYEDADEDYDDIGMMSSVYRSGNDIVFSTTMEDDPYGAVGCFIDPDGDNALHFTDYDMDYLIDEHFDGDKSKYDQYVEFLTDVYVDSVVRHYSTDDVDVDVDYLESDYARVEFSHSEPYKNNDKTLLDGWGYLNDARNGYSYQFPSEISERIIYARDLFLNGRYDEVTAEDIYGKRHFPVSTTSLSLLSGDDDVLGQHMKNSTL